MAEAATDERDELDTLNVAPEDGDDGEDFEGRETPSNQRTDVVALMVPMKDVTGWQGGDPPTKGFVASVRKRMRQPILVRDTGRKRGRYEIIDGRRRFKALMEFAKEDGITEVAVVVEEEASDLLPITLNALRSDNVIDSARRVWKRLDRGETDRDIALDAADGVAEIAKQLLPTIQALRKMRNLRPELIEAVEAKKMSPWSAKMAARQPDVVQQRYVDIYRETGRVTPDDVVAGRRAKQIEAAQEPEIVDAIAESPDDLGDDDEGFDVTPDLGDDEEAEELPATQDNPYAEYQGATSNGQPSISAEQRRTSAIRLFVAGAKELGYIQGTWDDVEGCIRLAEDIITTLKDLS